jgi:gamma-glutamylcyclotransferase (GGCT)/AIG2-like uncharacterized protein YtfP
MLEPPYLFVYGTLRAINSAGTEWSRFLTAASRFVGSGRTRGELFHLDGYPGMTVRAGGDAWVSGEVCLLNDPVSALSRLDEYEGCSLSDPLPHEFERQVVTVLLGAGGTVQAWAYIYSLETAGEARIVSGDYLRPGSAAPAWRAETPNS